MMKRTYDEASRKLTWTFGGNVPILAFVVPAITATDPTADTALIHGYTQKIGDAAAIPKNEATGKSATDAEKRAAMAEIVDRLLEGEWNGKREGGVNIEALVAAIVKITKKSDAGVRAFVESKDDLGKKALRDSTQFAAAYATAVAAMRPKREIDAAMKSELDAIK
jgi:hypothetical protein